MENKSSQNIDDNKYDRTQNISKREQIFDTSSNQDQDSNNEIQDKQSSSQNDQMDNSLQPYLMYKNFEDLAGGQPIRKIEFIQQNFITLFGKDQIEQDYQIRSFYGYRDEIFKAVNEYMDCQVNFNSIKEHQKKECKENSNYKFEIWLVKGEQRIAIFLLNSDELYQKQSDGSEGFDNNSEIVDFIKFLQDFSQKTVLCTPSKINNIGIAQFKPKKPGIRMTTRVNDIEDCEFFDQKELIYNMKLTKDLIKNKKLWNQHILKIEIEHEESKNQKKIYLDDYITSDVFLIKNPQQQQTSANQLESNYGHYQKALLESKNLRFIFKKILEDIKKIYQDDNEPEINQQNKQAIERIKQKYENLLEEFQEKEQIINEKEKKDDIAVKQTQIRELKKQKYKEFWSYLINQEKILNYGQVIQYNDIITMEFYQNKVNNQLQTAEYNNNQNKQEFVLKGQIKLLDVGPQKLEFHKSLILNESIGFILFSQRNIDMLTLLMVEQRKQKQIELTQLHFNFSKDTLFYIDSSDLYFTSINNKTKVFNRQCIRTKPYKLDYPNMSVNIKFEQNKNDDYMILDFIYLYKFDQIVAICQYKQEKSKVFIGSIEKNQGMYSIEMKVLEICSKQHKDNNLKNVQEEDLYFRNFIQSKNDKYMVLQNTQGIYFYDVTNFNFLEQYKFESQENNQFAQIVKIEEEYYLTLKDDDKIICLNIQTWKPDQTIESSELPSKKSKLNQSNLNHCISYFYGSILKYGNGFDYKTQKKQILICQDYIKKSLDEFLKLCKRQLINFNRLNREFKKVVDIKLINEDGDNDLVITKKQLILLLVTRVPVQIATIHRNRLYPLKNNKDAIEKIDNIVSSFDKNMNSHEQLKTIFKKIKFAQYELFQPENIQNNIGFLTKFQKIKIISVMGRQSLGKSYLLNRIFGTRFNVDPRRCTNGLWISLSYEENEDNEMVLNIIIDCEGLFNVERLDQDEQKLALVCFFVSDLVVFNCENNISKSFNNFFLDLQTRIRANFEIEEYRKKLLFLVRDIRQSDQKDVEEEFKNCLKFDYYKDMKFRAISNFENNENFLKDLASLKQYIEKDIVPTETNIENVFHSLKYTIVQVYFQKVSSQKFQIFISESYELQKKCLELFLSNKINEHIQKSSSNEIDEDIEILLQDLAVPSIELNLNNIDFIIKNNIQKEVLAQFKQNHFFVKSHHRFTIQLFCKQAPYDERNHNNWINQYYIFCHQIICRKKEKTLQIYEEEIQKFKEYMLKTYIVKERIQNNFQSQIQSCKNEINRALQDIINDYYTRCKLDKGRCKYCKRYCILNQNHDGSCNCYTNHQCDQKCGKCCQNPKSIKNQIKACGFCNSCKSEKRTCALEHGHTSQIHKCDKDDHYCPENCEVDGCNNKCRQPKPHKNIEQNNQKVQKRHFHDCGRSHQCKQRCSLETCQNICVKDPKDKHGQAQNNQDDFYQKIHECDSQRCPMQCELCGEQCIFPSHFHDWLVKAKRNQGKRLTELQKEDILSKAEGKQKENPYHHNCGKIHNCQKDCESNGICELIASKSSQRNVNQVQQSDQTVRKKEFIEIEKRSKCSQKIGKFQLSHEGQHQCKSQDDHICQDKCPLCQAFCQLRLGEHENQLHKTENHRGISEQMLKIEFQNDIKIKGKGLAKQINIKKDKIQNRYNLNLKNFKLSCTEYCISKKRGHQHFLGEGTNQQNEKEIKYLFCNEFFERNKWVRPLNDKQKEDIDKCNETCRNYRHKIEQEIKYCEKPANHIYDQNNKQHYYSGCEHKKQFEFIQICFLIDLAEFQKNLKFLKKNVIQKIIENKKYIESTYVSVVCYSGYKDDLPSDHIKHMNFTNNPRDIDNFIQKQNERNDIQISATYRRMEDGLEFVSKQDSFKWDVRALKILYIITDQPPRTFDQNEPQNIVKQYIDSFEQDEIILRAINLKKTDNMKNFYEYLSKRKNLDFKEIQHEEDLKQLTDEIYDSFEDTVDQKKNM